MGLAIIGGTGFLGRHFCEALAAREVKAAAISFRPDHRFLAEFAPTVTGCEVGTDEAAAALDEADTVVHLAHRSRPASNIEAEGAEIAENVEPATRLFAELAAKRPGARVIYASSGGQIYGAGRRTPIPETAPAAPITAYALGKHLIEQALFYFAARGRLRTTVLRLANPVGRWQLGGRHGLVSAAVAASRSGAAMTLYGAGANMRDYFDAEEFAGFLADLALDPARPDGVFNIGSGIGLSERDIFDRTTATLGRALKVEERPARPFDLPYAVLDTSKARDALGWRAATPIEASIRKMDAALGSGI